MDLLLSFIVQHIQQEEKQHHCDNHLQVSNVSTACDKPDIYCYQFIYC
jgi:hypothetical protein